MTDEDVIARAAQLFGQRPYQIKNDARAVERGWKTVYQARVRGAAAVALMRRLRPLMGVRRQGQIDNALATYREPAPRLITEADARELARRYWDGDRRPTFLGSEYGISKNLAILYINKYRPVAQAQGARTAL